MDGELMIEASRRDFMVGVVATAALASAASVAVAATTINERWLYWHDGTRDLDLMRVDFSVERQLTIPMGAEVVPEHRRSQITQLSRNWIAVAKRLALAAPDEQFSVDIIIPRRDRFEEMRS